MNKKVKSASRLPGKSMAAFLAVLFGSREADCPNAPSGHCQLHLVQEQAVGKAGDESGIAGAGGFAVAVWLEDLPPLLITAPLPGMLNGIADGALHLGGRAGKLFGYAGIELLCDGLHGVANHQQHSLPQIGIAPQLCGDAKGNQQIGDFSGTK